jgi:hypothetical protein
MAGDEPYPPTHDLSAYRRVRQDSTDQALITLFAAILGKPLERRELTAEQRARREQRIQERRHRSG